MGRTCIFFLFISTLLSCEQTEKVFKRTSISLPSKDAIFTAGDQLDSLTQNIEPIEQEIPNSIVEQIKRNIEAHIGRPLTDKVEIKKSLYNANGQINLFNITFQSSNPILGIDYTGLYRNNNFDFFTSTFADSLRVDIETELTKFEEVNGEYLITYAITLNGQTNYSRLTFRDTLNQLQWYKIEL